MSNSISEYLAKRKASKKEQKQPETFTEQIISLLKTLPSAIVIVMLVNGLLVANMVVPTGSMERTVMTGDFLLVNKFIFGPSTPQIIPFLEIPLPFYRFPGIREPKKGDVIVFIYPGDRDQEKANDFTYYLKRCVATSGDTLQVINKDLFVNGQRFADAPNTVHLNVGYGPQTGGAMFPIGTDWTPDNYGPIIVPKKGVPISLSAANFRQWETFIRREGHKPVLQGETVLVDGQPVTSYTPTRNYVFGMGDNRNNSLDSRFWGFIPVDDVVGTPLFVYWSWEMTDDNGNPVSLGHKLQNIRFNRLGTIIR